jgi:hypothetical protein
LKKKQGGTALWLKEWKTRFYAFEGFNTANGWPTRKTLEDMGLKKVADVMQSKNRLD